MNIQDLEEWFKTAPAPQTPVYLDEATRVNDYPLFVNSHFEGIRNAKVEAVKAPLIQRLEKMKLLIGANL